MKKYFKYIPYLLIAIYVIWFCIKFFSREMPKNDPQGIDWSELKETTPINDAPSTIKLDQPDVSYHEMEERALESDEEFVLYEEMETKWLEVTKELLGDKTFDQYLLLRERNEKEKLTAYEEYHDFLKNKYGDKFSYNISEDQSQREVEINNQFLRELEMLIGETKFKKFLENKDKINEEYLRNNKLFMQIEF